jgi:UDP-2-acetamido-2,6-beta-L-arabino-hexul-4-ose reductase
MTILVTGAQGFIARNLVEHLKVNKSKILLTADRSTDLGLLKKYIYEADVVFHLAGVNRPVSDDDFVKDNFEFTKFILEELEQKCKMYQFHYASSSQAELSNAYGISKKTAEDYLLDNVKKGRAFIYRFQGVFGKWSRPNYNSVIATFCYNLTRDIPLHVSDPSRVIQLIYIDDLISHLMTRLDNGMSKTGKVTFETVDPIYSVSLGEVVKILSSFKSSRETLLLPDLSDDFVKKLYTTYVSYLPIDKFVYDLKQKTDERGTLFELIKTSTSGQIFVSSTHPGVTRGNHFHHLKTEKFCVISGEGIIRFRKVGTEEKIEYLVSGRCPQVLDIPPGYTHNITNVGNSEMITLFWANEIFNSDHPDTYFETV